MKKTRIALAVLFALAFTLCAGARSAAKTLPSDSPQSSPPATASSDTISVPVGLGIVGTLSTELDTRHSRVGDPVEVEVTQDVLEGDHVVLRRGSHVAGHVTDISAYSRKVTNARLEIVFDKIIPKSGGEISTYLVVYAIAARHDEASDNMQDSRPMAASAQSPRVPSGGAGPAGNMLKPDSKGVFNLFDLSLTPMARDNPPTSLVHSQAQDILLDKGTEVVLVVEGNTFPSDRSSR